MSIPAGHGKAAAPGDRGRSGAAEQESIRLGAGRRRRARHMKLRRRAGRRGEWAVGLEAAASGFAWAAVGKKKKRCGVE